MARINLKSKRTWKKIGTIVLSVVLALGSVVGVTALITKVEEQTHKTISPTFHVGELNENDGEYVKSNKSIYSDSFECQGLKITPDFESDVSFKVFYYDNNENFITCTETLENFYNETNLFARYARIEITPKDNSNVSWFEILKYSNQIKVEIDKVQLKPVSSENMFKIDVDYIGILADEETFDYADHSEYSMSAWIDTMGATQVKVIQPLVTTSERTSNRVYFGINNAIVSCSNLDFYVDYNFCIDHYEIVLDIPKGMNSIQVSYLNEYPLEVYLMA